MTGSAVNVLVGLAVLLFIMSTLASALLSGILRAGRSRQKTMFRSVAQLLDGSTDPGEHGFTADFYQSDSVRCAEPPQGPLVERIRRRIRRERRWDRVEDYRRFGPTWISSKSFRAGAETAGVEVDENDYSAHMEALSGHFQRRARIWLFVIGLLGAVIVNVDLIAVGRALWEDDAVRAAVQDETNTSTVRSQVSLPIGWRCADATVNTKSCTPWLSWGDALPGALVGWPLTALAISLGAPVWYDAIRLVAGRRPRS